MKPNGATMSANVSGDLLALVKAEQRLEGMLAQARAQAAELVTTAREVTQQRAAALEADLGVATRELDLGLAAERRSEEARIAAEADREVQRYSAIDDDEVERLARHAVTLLVAGDEAS